MSALRLEGVLVGVLRGALFSGRGGCGHLEGRPGMVFLMKGAEEEAG